MADKEHRKRILNELRAAGMTLYGTMKMETDHLPKFIHEDEHIGGVVYGRTTGDKVGSAMLVATDKRILFLDVKPFFTTSDEISYFVVSGVKMSKAGAFAGIILHTKIRDYGLRFANTKCATNFVTFIEKHIELHNGHDADTQPESLPTRKLPSETKSEAPAKEANSVIMSQSTAVLSSVDRQGNVHGSVIHYVYEGDEFYFVTKSQTHKAQNIALHGQVALTIHEQNSLKLVQISGLAEEVSDSKQASRIYSIIANPKLYKEGHHFPPIVSMKKGDLSVIRITPMDLRYRDFSKSNW